MAEFQIWLLCCLKKNFWHILIKQVALTLSEANNLMKRKNLFDHDLSTDSTTALRLISGVI